MNEIKDNIEIQDVKVDNLCCTCQNGPTVIKNESQCKENCCTPKTVVCPDIREAKCMPALIDRIYDCVCLENEQTRCAKDKTFEIIWADTQNLDDLVGKEVCINTIALQYDCLGIKEDSIPTEIGNLSVDLQDDSCSQCCDDIFTEYSGSIPCVVSGCCENGRIKKICQSEITPGSCKLSIIVEGTAGCIAFKAQYSVDNLADDSRTVVDPIKTGLGFKDVDLFGQICLPDNRKKITLNAIFDVCLSVPCVAPKSTVESKMGVKPEPSYVFDANIFASLLVTEKLYVVVKDEVVVYTTPNTLSCTNGGFTSNCESEC